MSGTPRVLFGGFVSAYFSLCLTDLCLVFGSGCFVEFVCVSGLVFSLLSDSCFPRHLETFESCVELFASRGQKVGVSCFGEGGRGPLLGTRAVVRSTAACALLCQCLLTLFDIWSGGLFWSQGSALYVCKRCQSCRIKTSACSG
ncbi:hypothetical protein VTK73DRAFT_5769 [Phialemonium thermophilum]|uniref:Secreted protein n=1 Tax=Phialemonium thermophilum TaxID=223376 RepID=A0ABR3V1J4_9PEZI